MPDLLEPATDARVHPDWAVAWDDPDGPPVDPFELPKGYELIDETLTEKPDMGFASSMVVSETHFVIRSFLQNNPVGVCVTGEPPFQCFDAKPKQVRKPDAAVILCDPATFLPPKTNYLAAPAIEIEVLSPRNRIEDVFEKIEDFLAAGTRLVWIIDPNSRLVQIHRPDGSVTKLRDPAALTGEDVLPGLVIPTARILPAPVR